jgi:hypothetical protein
MRILFLFSLLLLLFASKMSGQADLTPASTLTEVPVPKEADDPFPERWSVLFGFGTSLYGSANVWNNYLEDRGFGRLKSSSFFGIFDSQVQYPLKERRADLEIRVDKQYQSYRAWGAKLQMVNSGVVFGYNTPHGDLDVKFRQQSLELYHRRSSAPEMASSTSVYAGPGIHRLTYSFFDGPDNFQGQGTWSSTRQFFQPGLTGGVTLFPFRGRGRVIWGIDIAYTYVPIIKVQPQLISSWTEPDGVTVRGGRINPSTLAIRFLVGRKLGRR